MLAPLKRAVGWPGSRVLTATPDALGMIGGEFAVGLCQTKKSQMQLHETHPGFSGVPGHPGRWTGARKPALALTPGMHV